jgi:putative DNA primase/helicase
MAYHEKTTNAARGKWKGILLQLGIPAAILSGKHGPCPLCQSKDNFRFDNREHRGTWICTCGAGDGMKLATAFTGKPFTVIAAQIDDMLGNVKPDGPSRPAMSDDDRVTALKAVWVATSPVQIGDLAHKYMVTRQVDELIYPKALRFGAAVMDGAGGVRPCMVAVVSGPDGTPVTLHRTFLRPDGLAKAEMDAPRKLMAGEIPAGSAVQLSEYKGGALGVAEGIETALSASALYGLPVWACISAPLMAKWLPPEGCEEVAIFGDNDPKFAGQAAAYTLAHRLAVKGIVVTVHIPPIAGQDFNDVLAARMASRKDVA